MCFFLRQFWQLLPLIACASLVGCGDGLASVTGAVTLDGRPIAGGSDVHATVCFTPAGGGAPGVSALDAGGRYELTTGGAAGIRPGKYLVAVSATKLIPAASPGMPPGGQPITPRKYANAKESGLDVEVHPGSNTLDFTLQSNPSQ